MSAGVPGAVVAVGWATVELDRAAASFASLLAPGSQFTFAADCIALGARCRIARTTHDLPVPGPMESGGGSVRTVILLEPATEGRLAAYLARHGEGWCATWTVDDAVGGSPASGGPLGPLGPLGPPGPLGPLGPLGPEHLLAGSSGDGPFRFLVSPATIRS